MSQMFPIAVACGNTFVLKPCVENPGEFHCFSMLLIDSVDLEHQKIFKAGTFIQ